jgi:hypothetical protein
MSLVSLSINRIHNYVSCNTTVLKALNVLQVAVDHRFESYNIIIRDASSPKHQTLKTTTMSELIALSLECLTRFTIST